MEDDLPFWFRDQYREERAGASLQEIEDAESYVGRRLPEELRRLLLVQDGGVSNYSGFSDGDRYFPLLPVFGAGASARSGTLMTSFDVREAFGVPDGIVVFAGEGHSWLGLDYSGDGDEPAVVFRLDEDAEIEVVARTFPEFINGLVEDDE